MYGDNRHCEEPSGDEATRRLTGRGEVIHTYGDNSLTFKGIPLTTIAHEWLLQTGGEPAEGERNDRLHKLALRLRYITD